MGRVAVCRTMLIGEEGGVPHVGGLVSGGPRLLSDVEEGRVQSTVRTAEGDAEGMAATEAPSREGYARRGVPADAARIHAPPPEKGGMAVSPTAAEVTPVLRPVSHIPTAFASQMSPTFRGESERLLPEGVDGLCEDDVAVAPLFPATFGQATGTVLSVAMGEGVTLR